MTIETLVPSSFSGTGFTGDVADIDEGVSTPDGLFISAPANARGVEVLIDFTDVVNIVDSDNVAYLDFFYRTRYSDPANTDQMSHAIFINGEQAGPQSNQTANLQTFFQNYVFFDQFADGDHSVADLNTIQVVMAIFRSGMPIDISWDLDAIECQIRYNLGAILKPRLQTPKFRHLLTR